MSLALRRDPPYLLVASNNRGKLLEIRGLLGHLGTRTRTPADVGLALEIEETGATFEENAVLKAEAFRDASGLAAIADDSGLVVDALGGGPGVFSARFGGPGLDDAGRNALLIERLRAVPAELRSARFVCVIALARMEGDTLLFRGEVEGSIAAEPRGTGGFGYDPIFLYAPLGRTFAELSRGEKAAVGHRGKALAAARGEILKLLEGDILSG